MEIAFQEAAAAAERGEVPVGAVVVERATGTVLARAGNRVEADNDPTAHAEILALREACRMRGEPRLPDCDLYVTLEPCAMCATALSHARIARVVYGAYDPKGGGVEHGARIYDRDTCHHRPDVVGGVQESRASSMLKRFFEEKR
ncbi:nucleoside deaminase [Rhodospirillaceae bacterium KN72]|uniref:tRNA-specific adenosine deaminase n=2 Tax=Pacificispira spongiicola TaxID=2729598 RepID=A0A7Y0HG25_9PROT|nr:nucleoside deaminase [Pacificispira spongiicola]